MYIQVIVLWTANTERFCDVAPGLNDTAENLLQSIDRNEEEVSPSTIFAVASVLEGVSIVIHNAFWLIHIAHFCGFCQWILAGVEVGWPLMGYSLYSDLKVASDDVAILHMPRYSVTAQTIHERMLG